MFKKNIRFITFYGAKETAMFCSAKNSIPIHQKTNVIYKSLILVVMSITLEV